MKEFRPSREQTRRRRIQLVSLFLLTMISIFSFKELQDNSQKEKEQNLIAYIEQVMEENPTASGDEEVLESNN